MAAYAPAVVTGTACGRTTRRPPDSPDREGLDSPVGKPLVASSIEEDLRGAGDVVPRPPKVLDRRHLAQLGHVVLVRLCVFVWRPVLPHDPLRLEEVGPNGEGGGARGRRCAIAVGRHRCRRRGRARERAGRERERRGRAGAETPRRHRAVSEEAREGGEVRRARGGEEPCSSLPPC
eukprot:scaffold181341_cov25-Tisochrysis_lutea.AAC.3